MISDTPSILFRPWLSCQLPTSKCSLERSSRIQPFTLICLNTRHHISKKPGLKAPMVPARIISFPIGTALKGAYPLHRTSKFNFLRAKRAIIYILSLPNLRVLLSDDKIQMIHFLEHTDECYSHLN